MNTEETVNNIYNKVEQWQKDFLKRHVITDQQYYANAASGLNIALQEIDHERWENSSRAIWEEYQHLLEVWTRLKPCDQTCHLGDLTLNCDQGLKHPNRHTAERFGNQYLWNTGEDEPSDQIG